MPRKIIAKNEITISEAKKLLEEAEELNQFQMRTLEYAKKGSKVDPSKAAELVALLIKTFEIDRKDAVQVVNCMPHSIPELRVFFSTVRKKIILTSQLEKMLDIVNKYRTASNKK